MRFVNSIQKCLKSSEPDINEHPIDDFIDNYWVMNIPNTLTKNENQEKVYGLIKEILNL